MYTIKKILITMKKKTKRNSSSCYIKYTYLLTVFGYFKIEIPTLNSMINILRVLDVNFVGLVAISQSTNQ